MVSVVVDVADGLLLWLIARLMAPSGFRVSFWRCLVATILVSIATWALPPLLEPSIGDWASVVTLLTFLPIIQLVIGLPFWRSVLATVIYNTVFVGIYYLCVEPYKH
jgi:hypothetical protein